MDLQFIKQLKQKHSLFRFWEGMSRQYARSLPPARPSSKALALYDEFIKTTNLDGETAVILGSTPELRSLAANYFRKIFVVDFSPAMLRVTNGLISSKILSKEVYRIAEWSHIADVCSPKTVDLVMGDSVFKQLDPAMWQRFLKGISSILKTGGVFITRVRIKKNHWRTATTEDIIRISLREWQDGHKDASGTMIFRFYDKFADVNGRVSLDEHIPELKSALADFSERSRRFVLKTVAAHHPHHVVWTHASEEVFESEVRNYFAIENKRCAEDYLDSDAFPVYLFRNVT